MTTYPQVSFVSTTPTGPVGIELVRTGATTAILTIRQWTAGQPQDDFHAQSHHSYNLYNIAVSGSMVTCSTSILFWTVGIEMMLTAPPPAPPLSPKTPPPPPPPVDGPALTVVISNAPASNGTTVYPITADQYTQIQSFIAYF